MTTLEYEVMSFSILLTVLDECLLSEFSISKGQSSHYLHLCYLCQLIEWLLYKAGSGD